MGNASARDRALQRRRHVRLHGDVGEAFWTVFAGECERHGRKRNLPRCHTRHKADDVALFGSDAPKEKRGAGTRSRRLPR